MRGKRFTGFAKARLLRCLCLTLLLDNGEFTRGIVRGGADSHNARTPTFDLREVGETHLKVQEENGDEGLLRADVAVSGAIVFVTVNAEERGYPIVIENASDFSFTLSQAVSSFALVC